MISSCSFDLSRQLSFGVVSAGVEYKVTYSPESIMWQYDTLEYKTFPASEGNLWLMIIGFSFEI